MLKLVTAVGLFVLSGCAALRVAPRQPWPSALSPYLECRIDDPDIVIAEVQRRPADAEKTREVQVRGGVAPISVVDGYRVMYGSKASKEFVANVKVERSEPTQYTQDKARVIESFETMAVGEGGRVQSTTVDGVAVSGVDAKDLEKSGTLGVRSMFSDRSSVIVTIYLLNQSPEHRKLPHAEQYAHTRDEFLKAFARCMRTSDGLTGTAAAP